MFDIFEQYSEEELKLINYNFAFLELLEKDDDYSMVRGSRSERNWNYIHTDGSVQNIIKEIYTYEYDLESDGKSRRVSKITKKVEFYNPDGSVGLERIIKQRSDEFYLEGVNRDIRHNRVDYLKSQSRVIESQIPYMPTSPMNLQLHYQDIITSIDSILSHYSLNRVEYIEDGEIGFELAIINETDTTVLNNLNKLVIFPGQDPKWPSGQTIKQAILHQLNGDV